MKKEKKFDIVSEAIKVADAEYRQTVEGCCRKKHRSRSKALYDYDVAHVDDLFKNDIKEAMAWFAERKKAVNIKLYGEMAFKVTVADGLLTFKDSK